MTRAIGFIGLGAMGAPMLERLAASGNAEVYGFDMDANRCTEICADAGARPADNIADIAAKADFLFSCLPDNDVVRAVYLAEEGVSSTIKPGTITIDCSTVGPDATRDVYAALSEKGAKHLDASMLGSVTQAAEGTISFVVGGDADAFEIVKPLLKQIGQMIRHVGPSGTGNQIKLIHQTLVAGHAIAVAEALALCRVTDTDIETFYDIVTKGTGFAYSRYFENRVPRMRDGEFSPLFMLKFMAKDARLARDMAPNSDRLFPMLSTVIATLEEGEAAGFSDEDFSSAMKVLENRIGKTIARTD